jgi:molybdopterin/thiamine biosynthesis adenylyltransferase
MNKAESAWKTLHAFNPDIKIAVYPEKLAAAEFIALAQTCDLVIEATDSMENKEQVNAVLAKEKISCIYAILVGMAGFTFLSTQGAPCWNCLFRPAPVFATGRALPFEYYPSFGAAAGLLGSFISNIAVRHLLGFGGPVYHRIFYLSQLLPFKKLQLSSRGVKAIMTGHFKSSISRDQQAFPEGEAFFNEHKIGRDPECSICGRSAVSGT